MNKAVDLIFIYQFIKRLVTPFDETDAFKLGIIDEKGKKIKDPKTREEEESYGYFDRLVFNIKKLVEKVPGGRSKLGSYAAALFLIRESSNPKKHYTEEELVEGWYTAMNELEEATGKNLKELMEDAPTNATGANVAGTGDDKVHWKPDARKKDMKAFLRRYMENKNKRQKIKERNDFLKKMGLK
jgi:hypothetical protein